MTVGAAEDYAHRAVAIVGVGAVMPDAPDAGAFWANITGGRYSITDVPAGRWDPALYYDADPNAPEKTYSKIGGWVRDFDWDPLELEAADPAAGLRGDGRGPEVGGRVHARRPHRLRLARAAVRPRADRGHPRQRHGRREALPHRAADQLPRVRRRALSSRPASPRCRQTSARRCSPSRTTG